MRRFLALLTLICIVFLCGCSGYREIDRGYLVTAVGICKNDDNVQIYLEAQSSASTSKNIERSILTGSGTTTAAAFEDMKFQLVKPLYFEQVGTAVFQGTPSHADLLFLTDTLKIHYGTFLVQCNDVEKLFHFDSPGKILGYDIIGLIKNFEKETNTDTRSRIFEILKFNIPLSKIDVTNNRLTLISGGDHG